MREIQRIAVVKPVYARRTLENKFEPQPKKGWMPLQKVCFGILDKIGAKSEEKYFDGVQYIQVDGKSFIHRLYEQREAVLTQLGEDPGRLLIGSKTYYDLMQEEFKENPMSMFHTEFMWGYQGAASIIGLDVWIIPWMDGMIVLPNRVVDGKERDKIAGLTAEKEALDAENKKLGEQIRGYVNHILEIDPEYFQEDQ